MGTTENHSARNNTAACSFMGDKSATCYDFYCLINFHKHSLLSVYWHCFK